MLGGLKSQNYALKKKVPTEFCPNILDQKVPDKRTDIVNYYRFSYKNIYRVASLLMRKEPPALYGKYFTIYF